MTDQTTPVYCGTRSRSSRPAISAAASAAGCAQ
jgi:hypothetical protein